MVTDSICDHFFTTSKIANANLRKAGIEKKRIHFVGNTMIDTLYQNEDRLQQPAVWKENGLKEGKYFLVTLHRPSNVDDHENLKELLDAILENSKPHQVLFPVHPRTRKIIEKMGYKDNRLIQLDPLPYLEFIYLVKHTKCVITDSGGITEESTVLGIPCMTLRNSTERPETITIGTNELVGTNPADIPRYLVKLNQGNWKKGGIPEKWDGKAALRIVEKLIALYQ